MSLRKAVFESCCSFTLKVGMLYSMKLSSTSNSCSTVVRSCSNWVTSSKGCVEESLGDVSLMFVH